MGSEKRKSAIKREARWRGGNTESDKNLSGSDLKGEGGCMRQGSCPQVETVQVVT